MLAKWLIFVRLNFDFVGHFTKIVTVVILILLQMILILWPHRKNTEFNNITSFTTSIYESINQSIYEEQQRYNTTASEEGEVSDRIITKIVSYQLQQEDEGVGRIIITKNSIASKQQLHIPHNYYLDNDDTVHNNDGSEHAAICSFFRIRPILLVRHVLHLCHKHRNGGSVSSVRIDTGTEH